MTKEKAHHIIKQYRIYSVIIVTFFMFVTYNLIGFLETHHATMSAEAAAAFVSLALATIGAIKYGLESFMARAEKDD